MGFSVNRCLQLFEKDAYNIGMMFGMDSCTENMELYLSSSSSDFDILRSLQTNSHSSF